MYTYRYLGYSMPEWCQRVATKVCANGKSHTLGNACRWRTNICYKVYSETAIVKHIHTINTAIHIFATKKHNCKV